MFATFVEKRTSIIINVNNDQNKKIYNGLVIIFAKTLRVTDTGTSIINKTTQNLFTQKSFNKKQCLDISLHKKTHVIIIPSTSSEILVH